MNKKLLATLALVAMLGLASCGTQEDTTVTPENVEVNVEGDAVVTPENEVTPEVINVEVTPEVTPEVINVEVTPEVTTSGVTSPEVEVIAE